MQKINRKGMDFKTIALALGPLVLLGLVIGLFLSGGPTKIFQTNLPAVEDLHVLRHTLYKDEIKLEVMNSGPDPVTIAQVMVRGAPRYIRTKPPLRSPCGPSTGPSAGSSRPAQSA